MEGKKFDFQLFLQQLSPKITTYTQIHLLQASEACISFTVKWIISHKHKNYRFICSPQQVQQNIAILLPHLALYPIRRFTINSKSLKLVSFFEKVSFDELIYQLNANQITEALDFSFARMNTKKISFSLPLSFQTITSITTIVHKTYPKSDVNLHFKVVNYQAVQAIKFLNEWGTTLPQKPKFAAINQKQFGYPFPIPPKDESTKRRQQISLFYEQSQIFTLRQLDNLGCQMIVHQQIQEHFLKQIIEVLFKINPFASLQIQQLSGPALIRLIETVLALFEEGYYRIVVGNQLQLTPCRLILNTTGLSKDQVASIFELMKQPGHYEFICYSSGQHFPAALQLFRVKTLVKFNFFLPLEELPPLEQLLKRMEQHANQLLQKVYSYAGLLKKLAQQGYLAVNSIFYSLGTRP